MKVHLGCDYAHVKVGATNLWVVGSSNYTTESLYKVCALLKFTKLRKERFPSSPIDHYELYYIPLLGEEHHCLYQYLVGMAEWMVQIGKFKKINNIPKSFLSGSMGG